MQCKVTHATSPFETAKERIRRCTPERVRPRNTTDQFPVSLGLF